MKVVIVTVIFIFFITICYIVYTKNAVRIAEDNLNKTLSIILIFPDKATDEFYSTDGNLNNTDNGANKLSGIGEEIKKGITPYFTEKGRDAFLSHWFTFGQFCAGTGWRTDIKDLEIKLDSKSERRLVFQAALLCSKPGADGKDLTITGKAQYDNRGKLNYLKLSDTSITTMLKLNEELN